MPGQAQRIPKRASTSPDVLEHATERRAAAPHHHGGRRRPKTMHAWAPLPRRPAAPAKVPAASIWEKRRSQAVMREDSGVIDIFDI